MPTIGEIRSDEAADAYNENPPSDLHKLLVGTGEWIERLTGEPDAANAAMLGILDALSGPSVTELPGRNWRTEWESDAHDCAQLMRRGQDLTSLMAFAGFGIDPDTKGDLLERGFAIESKVQAFREFLDLVPPAWGDLNELRQVASAAEGRVALDNGRPVTPEQLAALAGIGLRAVQNLLAKKGNSPLRADGDGLVPDDVALAWLTSRPGFKDSVWQDPDRDADAAADPETEDARDADGGGYFFVPIAADGTAFTPDLWRGEGFTIGPRDGEYLVDDYRRALADLASMPRPSWRRPNQGGYWGIVRATDWRRQSARSLGLEA